MRLQFLQDALPDGLAARGRRIRVGVEQRAIHERAPDLAFLDVQMPDFDGFDVLQALGSDRAAVIACTTAYDE
jgi:CheY-like chemotaxis protein